VEPGVILVATLVTEPHHRQEGLPHASTSTAVKA
jgi:hypothetical protein